MTKTDLIESVQGKAQRHYPSQLNKAQVGAILDALGDTAAEQLAGGGELTLPGIGKLKAGARKARIGRNPATGAAMTIPASTVVKFNVTQALKRRLNP